MDGKRSPTINANLTAAADTTAAGRIPTNTDLSFQGPVKVGKFDVSLATARQMLAEANAHGKPNSDVLFPRERAGHHRAKPSPWDFFKRSAEDAAFYQKPFAHVTKFVKLLRDKGRREGRRLRWWQHGETGDAMRAALAGLPRYAATTRVAKHRLFVWLPGHSLPDSALIVFARSDDYFFGVLHSRFHRVWTLAQGTQLREKESGFRYTPTTCFETFPFPEAHAVRDAAIAAAAKQLNELRANWLNPPDWTRPEVLEFPGTVGGPWHRYIDPATVTDRGAFKVGTVRYPRLVARDADCAVRLKARTMTKLYNERPPWLADCHARLDAAVAAAYGWPADLTDEAILEHLLQLNRERIPVS